MTSRKCRSSGCCRCRCWSSWKKERENEFRNHPKIPTPTTPRKPSKLLLVDRYSKTPTLCLTNPTFYKLCSTNMWWFLCTLFGSTLGFTFDLLGLHLDSDYTFDMMLCGRMGAFVYDIYLLFWRKLFVIHVRQTSKPAIFVPVEIS